MKKLLALLVASLFYISCSTEEPEYKYSCWLCEKSYNELYEAYNCYYSHDNPTGSLSIYKIYKYSDTEYAFDILIKIRNLIPKSKYTFIFYDDEIDYCKAFIYTSDSQGRIIETIENAGIYDDGIGSHTRLSKVGIIYDERAEHWSYWSDSNFWISDAL